MTASWRDIARRHLATVTQNAIAAYGSPGDWGAVTKLMVKRTIDAAYPFGTRENHPYKIWLEERNRRDSTTPSRNRMGLCQGSYRCGNLRSDTII